MAEPVAIQKFVDADLDVDTLEAAVNEDKIITARLGREYASVPMASRLLVENGLLGSTPYSTYAKMLTEGASLPDESYAVVTNEVDTKKNGVYEKIDGVWVYSQYNPMSYTDKANDMRVSADSAQISSTSDLLDPSSEKLQFEMLNGNKQVLRVENDKLYADIHTLDGKRLTNADLNTVRTVYDLHATEDTSSKPDLKMYDGDELVADLSNNSSMPTPTNSFDTNLFYMDGGELKYANNIGSKLVETNSLPLALNPYTQRACLAVTNNDWFDTNQSVIVLGANGCQYPDPRKTLVIIPTYGQSLSVGSQGVPPISTDVIQPDYALMFDGVNARLDSSGTLGRTNLTNFNKVSGFEAIHVKNNTSDAADDLSKEMLHIPFAQKVADILAVENDAPIRLLSFAAGVGGTPLDLDDFPQYDQTGVGLKKGSNAYANLINAISKAKELAAVKGWSVVVPYILYQHGEADASNANYALRLNTLISDLNTDIKNITGQTQGVRFSAMLKANHYGFGTVGLEQMMQVAKDNALFNIIGSTYPAEPASWASDFTHRSARGYNYMGYMYAKAFVHELKRGFDSYQGLTFKNAEISNQEITVTLNVPVAPIQYKTTDVVLPDPTWGFRVVQNDMEVSISNVQIVASNSLKITLVNAPGAGEITLSCAMYGHSGSLALAGIPRSNICDSDQSFGFTTGGDSTENWLIPFTKKLTV